MKRIALFLAVAVAAIACQPKEEVTPASVEVTTPESELVIPCTGSAETPLQIAFTSALEWTAEVVFTEGEEPWCLAAPLAGKAGEALVSIQAEAYTGADNRTAKLVITSGDLVKEVPFTQLQKNALNIVKTSYDVSGAGETITLNVSSNAGAVVEIAEACASWIHVAEQAKGMTDSQIALVVDANMEYNETDGFVGRQGSVSVSIPDVEPVVITVKQEAKTMPESIAVFADGNAVIPQAGGSVVMTVDTDLEHTVTVSPEIFTLSREGNVWTISTTEAHEGGEARFADVTISFGDYAKYDTFYNVFQKGVNYNIWEVDMSTVLNRSARATMSAGDEIYTGVSIALYDGNVVVSAGDGSAPVILDKATGAKKGTIATGDFKPYTVAHDDAGNLVMANRIWNRWGVSTTFQIAYLAPSASELKTVFDAGYDATYTTISKEEYIGLSMDVKGDVSSNGLIALPHNNGDYVHNVISLVAVENGQGTQNNLTLDENYKGVSWAGAYFGAALHNHPGFALVGPSAAYGAVSCCYNENVLQAVDLTNGACQVLSADVLPNPWSAWSNAPTGMDIRTVGDKTYLVMSFASTAKAAPVVMLFDAATRDLIATTAPLPPFTVFQPTDAESTNYEYVHTSVTMEPAEGGIIVYLIDKSASTIAARFFKL